MIENVLKFNKKFVEGKEYLPYITTKYPDKRLAILSCMDTRLTELLPAALGIKNGDAKIIKNAGGVISHPFGSVMRSLLVAVYELNVNEIMVIGHGDCGMQNLNSERLINNMLDRGVLQRDMELLKYSGVDFERWLAGFGCIEESVKNTLKILSEHPLMPHDVCIKGFVIDIKTGQLTEVV